MSDSHDTPRWGSAKARRVLAALLRTGWSVKRQAGGPHKILSRPGWTDYVFAFHDGDEIGPRMMARIAKGTGIKPEETFENSMQDFRFIAIAGLQLERIHEKGGR